MKKFLSAVCLALLYIMVQGANAPDIGYFQRPDCTTLNPVAYSTVCLNTGSAGSLTQGNLYVYATASWVKLLQAETQTLDNVFDNGKTIDGATSFANAVRITDSSGDGVAIYRSAGNGPTVTCIVSTVENDCDHTVSLNTSKTWAVKNSSGTTLVSVAEDGTQTGFKNTDVGARVYKAAGQTISNATDTAMNFDTERYDTHAIHDTVTNNTRLTVTSTAGAGKYLIGTNIRFGINGTGVRVVYIKLNGTTIIAQSRTMAVTDASVSTVIPPLNTIYSLAVNDYLEVFVHQASGGPLDVDTSANYSPEFWIQKIS